MAKTKYQPIVICRCSHHCCTITDIPKTGHQVNKTLNKIIRKFSELTGILFEGWICSVRTNVYGVHLIASLVKRLIRGIHQGRLEQKYLQSYLDEYVFRFNRQKSTYMGKKFIPMVQQVVKSSKIKCDQIKLYLDPISEILSLELSV